MYQKNGNEIRSDRGVLVATLDGDKLIMASGKKSQEEKVRAFLSESASPGSVPAPDVPMQDAPMQDAPMQESPEETESPETPGEFAPHVFVGDVPIEHSEPPKQPDKPQTDAEWQVGTIPEEELPPFDPLLGVDTPGFQTYIEKHNLNVEQTAALIRRICKLKGW